LKAENLLTILIEQKIPIIRAVWVIKVICISQSKEKVSGVKELYYTSFWTKILINFLEKNEITDYNSILYFIKLIGWCFDEGLLDSEEMERYIMRKLIDLFPIKNDNFNNSIEYLEGIIFPLDQDKITENLERIIGLIDEVQ
jgi:hypothetical protein